MSWNGSLWPSQREIWTSTRRIKNLGRRVDWSIGFAHIHWLLLSGCSGRRNWLFLDPASCLLVTFSCFCLRLGWLISRRLSNWLGRWRVATEEYRTSSSGRTQNSSNRHTKWQIITKFNMGTVFFCYLEEFFPSPLSPWLYKALLAAMTTE